jgi:hypothetical protein
LFRCIETVQHQIYNSIIEIKYKELNETLNATNDKKKIATYVSYSSEESSSILKVIPKEAKHICTDLQFSSILCSILCYRQPNYYSNYYCTTDKIFIDREGHHQSMGCTSCTFHKNKIELHNSVNITIKMMATFCKIYSEKEPSHLFNDGKKPDLLIRNFPLKDKPVITDQFPNFILE